MTPNELFLHRLALAMGRTVDELLDSVSYQELMRWGVYYEEEPWGEWRADVRSAQIVVTLANINRDAKKRPEPYRLDEFLMFKPREREPQPQEGAKMDPQLVGWLFSKSGAHVEE